MREREEEGRTETTCGARRSWSGRRRRSELVADVALGRPRSYGWYGKKRLGVGSRLVCSGRHGAVLSRRNRHRSVVGTEGVLVEI